VVRGQGEGGCGNYVIQIAWDQGGSQHILPGSRIWRPSTTPAMGLVLFPPGPSGNGTCYLLGRVGPPTTTLFTFQAPCCLNFSMGLCQTLFLSMVTSCGHLPPRHCGRMSQDSLSHDCSLLSSSQSSSDLNHRLSLKMAPYYNYQR
jgi:hypothetical protein